MFSLSLVQILSVLVALRSLKIYYLNAKNMPSLIYRRAFDHPPYLDIFRDLSAAKSKQKYEEYDYQSIERLIYL